MADFHIARSDFQAAAGAQLAYARRLVAECPEEPAMLAEAEHALVAAVSCLRCALSCVFARVSAECLEGPAMLAEAEHALAAAVSCLR